MDSKAYARIDAWQLPRPRVVDISELSSLPPETRVYVRGPKSNILLNRRCLVESLIVPEVLSRLTESEGLTIEVSPDLAFGGAALLCGPNLYLESVYGHISSLLHSGQCSMRSLKNRASGEILHHPVRQEFLIAQSLPRSTLLHCVPDETTVLCSVVQSVANSLSVLGEEEQCFAPLLFEWMWTTDGELVFIDCKNLEHAQWHHKLSGIVRGNPGIVEATVLSSLVEVCLIRDFCSDFTWNLPPFYARVTSQALLSHFFTYTSSVPRIIEMTW